MLALLSSGSPARAQNSYEEEKAAGDALFSGNFVVDDADPEAQIPSAAARNENPVAFASFLFQLGDKAEAAKQRGDTAAAVKYHRALAAAVPEVSASFRELCKAYLAMGDVAKAERSCEVALSKRGVMPADFETYIRLVVSMPGELRATQIDKLNTLVQHLKAKTSTAALAWQLDCQVASRLGERARIEACVAELVRRQLPAASSLPFRWKLAMLQRNYAEARQLLESPEASSVADSELQRMDAEMRLAEPPAKPAERGVLALRPNQLGIIGIASLVVLAVALYLTRRTGRTAAQRR